MTKVRVKRTFEFAGNVLKKGDTPELPDSAAESAVEKGYAEKAEEEGVPKIEPSEEPEEPEGEGVEVDEYMKSGGGWLTADEVGEGDVFTIKGPGHWDDETFDSRYLILPIEYKGSEYNYRCGKRNTRRIADEYGNNTSNWVGKKVEIAAIQMYEGVGSKGMILKPVE